MTGLTPVTDRQYISLHPELALHMLSSMKTIWGMTKMAQSTTVLERGKIGDEIIVSGAPLHLSRLNRKLATLLARPTQTLEVLCENIILTIPAKGVRRPKRFPVNTLTANHLIKLNGFETTSKYLQLVVAVYANAAASYQLSDWATLDDLLVWIMDVNMWHGSISNNPMRCNSVNLIPRTILQLLKQ